MSNKTSANQLKIQMGKTSISIALILILTFSALMAAMPTANAHTPAWTVPTYAYMAVIPSTQQVNQQVELVFWIGNVPPSAGGLGGDRWHNFKVNVTAPDGTKSQLGPYDSDQLGSWYYVFTPSQVGKYQFQFYWPGQTATLGTGVPNYGSGSRGTFEYVGDYFEPSQSGVVTLTVQQGPIVTWQSAPAPTGYWQLPISALNRDTWGSLASNWLGGAQLDYGLQREGTGPSSSHILWQIPIVPGFGGGLLDAQFWGINTNTRVYETPFGSPIIMNGVVYYNTPPVATTPRYGYYAVDLYTGKQLWYNNGSSIPGGLPYLLPNGTAAITGPGGMYYANPGSGAAVGAGLTETFPTLTVGQLYHVADVNGAGVVSYLWAQAGTNWYMLDASTGNFIMALKNVPSGTSAVDQDGSLLLYSYNPVNGNLLCWNSSQAIPPAGPTGTAQQQWKIPVGMIIDAQNDTTWTNYQPIPTVSGLPVWSPNQVRPRSGYTMNVTIPKGLNPGSISNVLRDSNNVPRQIFGWSNPNSTSGVAGGNGIMYAWCVQINYNAAPYSPYPNETATQNNNLGYTATLLWNKTINPPAPGNLTYYLGTVDYDDQVFTIWEKETRQNWGYSLTDGSLIWGPTDPGLDYDMYSFSISQPNAFAYGNIYRSGYGGQVRCYDAKTGALKWTYTATGIGLESPYNNYPLNYIGGICNGILYVYCNLGYVQQPLWRGVNLWAINATTGQLVWKIDHYASGVSIADGYLVSGDFYINQITCFGKGPTATTVTYSPVIGSSSSVIIQGTVTDQSPGAKGTPAISEASMEQWMEYLYKQQAMPTNATGVPVTLTALDPNNNTENIGTVTSDPTGLFSAMWTPPVPGKYTIIASFGGSNSYGASYAETVLGVAKAPAAQVPITTPAPAATLPPTVTPLPTITPSPQVTATPAPAPSSPGLPTTYIVIAVVAIIIVVAAAALALRRRK